MTERLDITAIILTFNEEIHIQRVLDNLAGVVKKIIVIDCFSKDNTISICAKFQNVEVVQHKWPGNQASQFNWALDNTTIDTEWVLRLDADEYLTNELINEMYEKLPNLDIETTAVVLPLGRAFLGKRLKHTSVSKMIRLFRKGKARYDNSIMDEHLRITEGKSILFKHPFVDDNLNSLSFFTAKHNNYSDREVLQCLSAEFSLEGGSHQQDYCGEVKSVKSQKNFYYRLPLFWRAILYFLYRYIFVGGFLDGKSGFCWCFFQGLWYRILIDAKILQIKRQCNNDPKKISDYISSLQ